MQPARLQGVKAGGQVFKADELYGYALFITPDGKSAFRIPLSDDAQGYDDVAGAGWFSASIHIETLLGEGNEFDPVGEWMVR